jgi:hypothetical protein
VAALPSDRLCFFKLQGQYYKLAEEDKDRRSLARSQANHMQRNLWFVSFMLKSTMQHSQKMKSRGRTVGKGC